jgi:hypothetical protein
MPQSFDNSITKTITFSGFTTSSYDTVEEVNYVKTTPLLVDTSSNKVRIVEDQSTNLDPEHSLERTSLELFGRDSNRLDIVFSPDKKVLLDAASNLGDFNIKEYVGDPRTETAPNYIVLESYLRNNWEQRLRTVPVSNYVRLFKLYDQGLFEQLKQLIPARVSPEIGFTLGLQNLYRNKTAKLKELGEVSNLSTDIESNLTVPRITEDSVTAILSTEPDYSFRVVSQVDISGEILNRTSEVLAEVSGLVLSGAKIINPEGEIEITSPEEEVLEVLTNINTQTEDDGTLSHLTYIGTQVSSPGFNLPTPETLDKKSVVEYVDFV